MREYGKKGRQNDKSRKEREGRRGRGEGENQ